METVHSKSVPRLVRGEGIQPSNSLHDWDVVPFRPRDIEVPEASGSSGANWRLAPDTRAMNPVKVLLDATSDRLLDPESGGQACTLAVGVPHRGIRCADRSPASYRRFLKT